MDFLFQFLLYGLHLLINNIVCNSFMNAEFNNNELLCCSVTDRLDTWEKVSMFFRQLTAKSHIIKMNQVCGHF